MSSLPPHITAAEAEAALREADLLFDGEAVTAAIERMAAAITARLAAADPLVLVVMHGALVPASRLFLRLAFPFQVGYLHVTRYRGSTRGRRLKWIARPPVAVAGRTVLVIDDIFDEGHTLKAVIGAIRRAGAASVLSAVLVNKRHDRKEDLVVDFVGLEVDDRYVFGCGMDYGEYWRNLPAIYALKEHS